MITWSESESEQYQYKRTKHSAVRPPMAIGLRPRPNAPAREDPAMAKHPLSGSDRAPLHGATAVGKADPGERLEVSVLVRRGAADAFAKHAHKLAAGDRSIGRMTRAQFADTYGADPKDFEAVRNFA